MSTLHFSNFSLEARNEEEVWSYNVIFSLLTFSTYSQTSVSIETESP